MRMRRLVAVAVVGLAVSVAAGCVAEAQRGGARGGGGGAGFHGGFAGHAVGGSHGGFAQTGPTRFGGGVRVQSYRAGGAAGVPYRSGGIAGARPSFYERGRGDRDRDGRGGERREGIGYGYVGPLNYGWLDANEIGYPDGGSYADDGSYVDDGGYVDDGSYGGDAANGPGDGSGMHAENYVEQPGAQGEPVPEGTEPVANIPRAAPRLYDSDAVTLVFKDGRAVEKIHNYALTRTTLYVTDGRHREIAVADLDLAATEKANRAAGVNFQLPQTQ